jgi:hypothetical protein
MSKTNPFIYEFEITCWEGGLNRYGLFICISVRNGIVLIRIIVTFFQTELFHRASFLHQIQIQFISWYSSVIVLQFHFISLDHSFTHLSIHPHYIHHSLLFNFESARLKKEPGTRKPFHDCFSITENKCASLTNNNDNNNRVFMFFSLVPFAEIMQSLQ